MTLILVTAKIIFFRVDCNSMREGERLRFDRVKEGCKAIPGDPQRGKYTENPVLDTAALPRIAENGSPGIKVKLR